MFDLKAILVILDGIADRSQGILGMRTPLQAAQTPNIDRIAQTASCGIMYPLFPGACAGSDLAHWHILGYGEFPYPGRSAIEALGAELRVHEGDVVIRLNLATTMIDRNERYVQISPAYLAEEEALRIAESLEEYKPEKLRAEIKHIGGPFFLMLLPKEASTYVTDSDPLYFRFPVKEVTPLEKSGKEAGVTAFEVNRFIRWSAAILEDHPVNRTRLEKGMTPVNYVLAKWASRITFFPSFKEMWGFDALIAARGIFYAGLTRCLGMVFENADNFPEAAHLKSDSASPGEDLSLKIEHALRFLDAGGDFAVVHTKAPDEASHGGRPKMKVRICEEIDKAFLLLSEQLSKREDILLAVTSNHTTPSGGSEWTVHSGEPVPLMIAGSTARTDDVLSFDEISCARGCLGQIYGKDFMPLILNFTDRARLLNSRTSPQVRPYREKI